MSEGQERRELERLQGIAEILNEHDEVKRAKTDRTGFALDVTFTDGSRYRLEMVAEKKPPAA